MELHLISLIASYHGIMNSVDILTDNIAPNIFKKFS